MAELRQIKGFLITKTFAYVYIIIEYNVIACYYCYRYDIECIKLYCILYIVNVINV